MANALALARSPYLLQHKDNPVAWREWNEETLAAARAEDKPILLSVGYAACHWCHVMAHESFESPEIAALMNQGFINVKVDREERPDLDTIYQHALALMGEQGGWPLTMFLTPAGEPFWGGTYFPPEPRYGRPSFAQVLQQIGELWRTGRDRLLGSRDQLLAALGQLSSPAPGELLDAGTAERAARALGEHFDAIHGGLGGAPKFPQAPVLELIWRIGLRSSDPAPQKRVLHTLRRICQGGIYDHLGGGFARYSVDAYWLVPHFEKMLYDNAQLLRLAGHAYAATGDRLFLERAEETVGWLQREMMVGGAFAASLDADSEGEEGKFYVWDAAEIDRLLLADAPAFKLAYGVTAKGNWEERNILNRLHEPGLPAPEEAQQLARDRKHLLAARDRRIPPARDDKVLADWNGLMIWGLAEAAGYCGRPEWLGMAGDALRTVRRALGTDGNRLAHSSLHGRRLETAFVDDYAQMSQAAIALFEQLGEREMLAAAQVWFAQAEQGFLDLDRGIYFQATAEAGLVVRALVGHDGPYPSGNGTMAWVAAKLWHLTGDEQYRRRAETILTAFAGEARRNPFAYGTLLSAGAYLEQAVQIVIVGEPGSDRFRELHEIAAAAPVPFRVILPLGAHEELPFTHPAHGKRLVGGAATAYVCVGTVCEAPITEPDQLRERLTEAGP
jgi:uncharacterized protein YyaL (SSP411 family)